MLGALIGDIAGSCYEGRKCVFNEDGLIVSHVKATKDGGGKPVSVRPRELLSSDCSFTDDTVLTMATAQSLLKSSNFAESYVDYFNMFSEKNSFYQGEGIGYGAKFLEWADKSHREGKIQPPYFSYGNGAAMRVSPIAYVGETLVDVLNMSLESCLCTHNTKSAIKSAQATAMAIWLARHGAPAKDIMTAIQDSFMYDLDYDLDDLIKNNEFNPTADGSVPIAIFIALTGTDFTDVIRNCLRVGGDTDTIACIAGSIAEPLFGIPDELKLRAKGIITRDSPFLWDKYVLFAEKHDIHIPEEKKKSIWSFLASLRKVKPLKT